MTTAADAGDGATNPTTLGRAMVLWRRGAYRVWASAHRDEPWMAPGAVAVLDRAIDRNGAALEWGSGRSTRWFADRVSHLTSVESDRAWAEQVRRTLPPNAELVFETFGPRQADPSQNQDDEYVRVVDRFADESLALVVVDGYLRQACVMAALPKLAPGGLLVVDDTWWRTFDEWGVPRGWPVLHHSTFLIKCTTVWRKPVTPAT